MVITVHMAVYMHSASPDKSVPSSANKSIPIIWERMNNFFFSFLENRSFVWVILSYKQDLRLQPVIIVDHTSYGKTHSQLQKPPLSINC